MKIEFDSTYENLEEVGCLIDCIIPINGEMFHIDNVSIPPQTNEEVYVGCCDLSTSANHEYVPFIKERCDMKGIVLTLSWMGNIADHERKCELEVAKAEGAGHRLIHGDSYKRVNFHDITKLIKG